MNTVVPYQRIKPCVSTAGHHFDVSQPEPGQWGHVLTYCTRCGKFRHELDVVPPKKENP